MNVVALQLDSVWEDKPANQARVRALLGQSPPPPAALVVLPEMFATGFSLDLAAVAEPADGPTHQCLADLARTYRVWIVGGVVTSASKGQGRNEAVTFDPAGRELARYAKMRPFTFGGESARIIPGDKPVVFDWSGFRVAPFICYDLRFPELFRAAALGEGAEVFVVLASWPAARAEQWTTLLRARAIENQAYVVGVNRCGRDPQHEYAGGSLIVGPRGEVLAAGGETEGPVAATLDRDSLLAYRKEFPALQDARR